ncbi:MAG: hypothetical protein P1U47_14460 [Zhongshania sp.]|uniref:hypothetical protein n=1 Tax=Zhongshania sp. TaxID=1971902 RepID=UPI002612527F|nr:hypothetical protein [Zhongshania sp.]MDF1693579.1 hypothetical protein [Zhongshania sp.]
MRKYLYGILLLVFCTPAFPQSFKPVIDLILPEKNEKLELLAKQIESNLDFIVHTYTKNLPSAKDRGEILIIVSEKLLPLINNNHYKANFALYVNSVVYKSGHYKNATALFSDQSIHKQLSLISSIYKFRSIRVGIAYQDPNYLYALEKEAEKFPLMHFIVEQANENNKLRSINKVIQNSDIVLATPETTLYNSQTIRSILLSSYRHQTLIIGPNEGFVNAGALASIISSPDQYTNEIIAMVNSFVKSNIIPEARHPHNYNVKLNYSVAESLGIELPSEEILLKEIAGSESQ